MIEVPMTVAVSTAPVPVVVNDNNVAIPAEIGVTITMAAIPRNYGKITFDGSTITVT